MSSNLRAQVANGKDKKWRWPLDFEKYNRSASLTAKETAALAHMASKHPKTGHLQTGGVWPRHIRADLSRITLPVDDALTLIRVQNEENDNPDGGVLRSRGHIRNIFASVTHKLQRTLWAWTQEEWINIFAEGVNISGYRMRGTFLQAALATAYLLTDRIDNPRACFSYKSIHLAYKVFGRALINMHLKRVHDALSSIGYEVTSFHMKYSVPLVLCDALILNRSGYLEDLSAEMLSELRDREKRKHATAAYYTLSNALASIGTIARPLLPPRTKQKQKRPDTLKDISTEWIGWVNRWRKTSTINKASRKTNYYILLKVGRWLKVNHPNVVSPEQWTRDIALEFVAAVNDIKTGQWASRSALHRIPSGKLHKPLAPRAKHSYVTAVRTFFRDCQEWEWITISFNPLLYLRTPDAIRSLIRPDPRVIADDFWAKLLNAGLNLTHADLPRVPNSDALFYPVEMVRAITIVWLFAGLRSDEINRLPLGCIRWQRGDVVIPGTDEVLPKDAVCWLDVPVNKTSSAFSKPVDRVLGEAVEIWKRVRPEQPKAIDQKTGELVDFLFSFRARCIGKVYINNTIIPLLCRKAGIPISDARGKITSHRARSTITSQLFNSDDPMSLEDLRLWLGHKNLYSTDHYAAKTPTRIAKAYSQAGYFERNLRTIKVLIDRDAVVSGAAAAGESWQYFDLGHGYCTYDFFAKCPHRMACPKCQFYVPKDSTKALMFEAKAGLQRMSASLPLTDEEREAVEEGIEYFDKLVKRLADVPTPAGPTPQHLEAARRQLPVIALTETEAAYKPEDDS